MHAYLMICVNCFRYILMSWTLNVYQQRVSSNDLSNNLCGVLLFLSGGSRAFAASGAIRGHLARLDWHILDQATVVEVDQRGDWNVLLLDVLIV